MKVALAVQVLSSTVASALEELYGDHVAETVNFIRIMDKFFDCLNVRSLYEGRNSRKPNMEPYSTPTDARLTWLQTDFLQFFQDWKQEAELHEDLTKKERAAMCLSHQTVKGLEITAKAVSECTIYVLEQGVPFVLTSVFNQDPLEQLFGHYRHKGGHNNNPTVYEVQNVTPVMRVVRSQALAAVRGNCKRLDMAERVIDNTPLPKRKK